MRFGYALGGLFRFPLADQIQALERSGIDRLFVERDRSELPSLLALIGELEPGDTVIVARLICIAQNPQHLIAIVKTFQELNVTFASVSDNFDVKNEDHVHIFQATMLSVCDLLSDYYREHVLSGQYKAKLRGVHLGRHSNLTPDVIVRAVEMLRGGANVTAVAKMFRVSRATMYRVRQKYNIVSDHAKCKRDAT